MNHLREGLQKYFTPAQLNILQNARIGIAGAGGLGSNAAMLLARCGIEHMVIIDKDVIEASNLNRQHYWPQELGKPKVHALAKYLQELNPHIKLTIIHEELSPKNLPAYLPLAELWLEAFDEAIQKKLFVEAALSAALPVIAASGIAGYGGPPLQKKKMGNLTIIGDYTTDIQHSPPLAPRVTQAAAMLADAAIEHFLSRAD